MRMTFLVLVLIASLALLYQKHFRMNVVVVKKTELIDPIEVLSQKDFIREVPEIATSESVIPILQERSVLYEQHRIAQKIVQKEETKQRQIEFFQTLEDVTEDSTVRATKAVVGVDMATAKNAKIGIQLSGEFHDSQDAKVWGQSVKDEETAEVKYSVSF